MHTPSPCPLGGGRGWHKASVCWGGGGQEHMGPSSGPCPSTGGGGRRLACGVAGVSFTSRRATDSTRRAADRHLCVPNRTRRALPHHRTCPAWTQPPKNPPVRVGSGRGITVKLPRKTSDSGSLVRGEGGSIKAGGLLCGTTGVQLHVPFHDLLVRQGQLRGSSRGGGGGTVLCVQELGASNGQVAVSALGCGRACPTTVIASVHQPLYGAASVLRVISSSIPDPVTSRCTSLLDSTGLCVHAGQWSLPPRAALVAGPTRPHQVGH